MAPILLSLGGFLTKVFSVFIVSKLPKILASIGFAFVSYRGLDNLLDFVISNIRSASSSVGVLTFYNQSIDFFSIASSCGIFDGVNIVLSGYATLAVLIIGNKTFRFVGFET